MPVIAESWSAVAPSEPAAVNNACAAAFPSNSAPAARLNEPSANCTDPSARSLAPPATLPEPSAHCPDPSARLLAPPAT